VIVAPPTPSAKGVYVLNEGIFGQGNSTLSYYDLDSSTIYSDVFFAVNNKHLGDVGNSITIRGTLGYIVVNNSNKIEIIDITTNINVGTIDIGSGRSPRQIAFLNDSVAFVTNLYDDSVLKLDLKLRVTGTRIPVGPNPEGIAIASGKAFVANSGLGSGKTVSVIDLGTLTVTKTIAVGDNPASVQITSQGMVYILCAGSYGDFANPNDDTPARIFVVDPVAERVVDSLVIGGHAFVMAIGPDGRGYTPATNAVIAFNTRTNTVTGQFLPGSFYSVGVEEVSGDVYVSDPKNYTQPGTVFIYSKSGQLQKQFEAGIIPGSFAFKRL
jgi:YVTN family beta-propeller protein